MLTVKEDTAIVGVSELRTKTPEVLEEIKKHMVILTRRNMPVGVIMDYGDYEKMSKLLAEAEDIVLAELARKRLSRKNRKAITLEDAEKKAGLR
ncbi:MAG: type II toxin-antitoxin system Phd/YefM family antitoxin [Thermodesulfobacteriota bacterium]